MENKKGELELVKRKLSTTIVYVLSVLFNSIFLCIWVIIQYGISTILSKFKTEDMSEIVLLIFQFIFAISTIIPIIIRLYTDIRIMVIQSNNEIEKEIKKN